MQFLFLSFSRESCGEEFDGTWELVLFVFPWRSACRWLGRSRTWSNARGRSLGWAAAGSARSAPSTLRHGWIMSADMWVAAPRADPWTLLYPAMVSSWLFHSRLPAESVSSLSLRASTERWQQPPLDKWAHLPLWAQSAAKVKQWTPSILNSLLTWCSGCGSASEATSCSLLFLVLFCL